MADSLIKLVLEKREQYSVMRSWLSRSDALAISFNSRFGRKGTRSVTLPGYSAPFIVRYATTDWRILEHVIACEGYKLPFDPPRPPRFIIDAGANVGYSAMYFAQAFPDAIVVAIEPDAQNFELLERNTAPFDNIHAMKAALWNHEGFVVLHDPGVGEWGFQIKEGDGDSGEVVAVTVNSLLQKYEMDAVDILKIDIEGGEYTVFEEPPPWIDSVNVIAIELHDRFQPGCTERFDKATVEFEHRGTRGEDTFVGRKLATV